MQVNSSIDIIIRFLPIGISLFSLYMATKKEKSTVIKEKEVEFKSLREDFIKLKAQFESYLDIQEQFNAIILHRPTHREVDELLEKRENLESLDNEEAVLLDKALEKIIYDKTLTVGFRSAAAQMLTARKVREPCIGIAGDGTR